MSVFTEMNLFEKVAAAILTLLVGTMIVNYAWFMHTHYCAEFHEITYQHINQPIYMGNSNLKFPIGGGDVETRVKTVCDKYEKYNR